MGCLLLSLLLLPKLFGLISLPEARHCLFSYLHLILLPPSHLSRVSGNSKSAGMWRGVQARYIEILPGVVIFRA
jgi:hypothetical protein